MSEKRRGLGRGLGALIPTAPEGSERPAGGERPADLFFGQARSTATEVTGRPEAGAANLDGIPAHVAALAAPSVDDRTTEAVSPGGATANGTGANGTNANGTNASGTNASGTNASGTDSNDVGTSGDVSGGTNGAASAATSQVRPASSDTDGLLPVPGARFAELPVGDISPNPRQPRTVFDEDALAELVGSIKEIGVLQPVVVRQVGDRYELIMGERRWRATQEAGLSTIPAIIRDTDDEDLLRDALLENLHRSQLNALEEAAAYQQLLDDFGCTHEQLASRISRSRPQISNTLRLLKLPPLVQRRVAAGVLSAGHARALLGLNDGAAIERLAQRIVAEGLSVRAVEEIVALGGDAAPQRRTVPRAGIRNEALDDLASRLSDKFETRVKVSLGKQRGRLTVEFASVQDLNRILASLAPEDPGLLKG
jgi:ParB family transcriptional regulator, chromosome partitioning protein